MAIDWNLWNQAAKKQQDEARQLYDFSFVTPEVVKGFTRYQALRPEAEIKEAEEFQKALEGLDEAVKNRRAEQWKNKVEADKMGEQILRDIKDPDMFGAQELIDETIAKGGKDFKFPQKGPVAGNAGLESEFNPLQRREQDKEIELVNREVEMPPVDPGMTAEEKAALETEILKERLGDRYENLKRSYDIYGSLNPYERMITAGKRSSYWDPEIGKIYTDAGEKIRNDQIQAWKEALEGETMLQKQAMDMYQKTGLSRYRREAERRLDAISNLLDNNPRNEGKWFSGYDTEKVTSPESASAYDLIEKKILSEGPMDEATLSALMNENGIKGEDKTDLLKQNQAEWKKRYGVESEVVKNTEEAIRAQSETFKKDQTERVKNLNLLDDLRTRLASENAGEADYRMAAETLRKLNLDISKSFDEKTAKLIEKAKSNMVNNPSFKTIGAFLVMTVGDKLGIMPGDLNAITSDSAKKKLIQDAVETLYNTDLNMYEVERENMVGYLKGVPGIDTSKLSWMQSRKPMTPNDFKMGAAADEKGNLTITLPNGQTDSWTVDMKEDYPEFFKFFNGKSSKVHLKEGTSNVLTDGRWEYNIDTKDLVEI